VPRTPTQAPPQRDAVVQLLGTIWDNALDPGYAAAARRRQSRSATSATSGSSGAGQGRERRPGRGALALLGFAVLGVVLAVAIVSTHVGAPAVAQRRADLVDRVRDQTARAATTEQQVQALQADVSRLNGQRLSTTSQGELLADQVAALELATAQVAVTGPGLRVTLDDASEPPPGTDPAVDRVLDRDLQGVVNGLWAAGAEAVAVNGQRLTALSAIRSAGDAILVDYRPLTRPYVVVAIGDPASLQTRFTEGAAGRGLQALSTAYGIRSSVQPVGQAILPAASPGDLRYARGIDQ
jgi:uncharacterized protein YlxW (UPF0749 family)